MYLGGCRVLAAVVVASSRLDSAHRSNDKADWNVVNVTCTKVEATPGAGSIAALDFLVGGLVG